MMGATHGQPKTSPSTPNVIVTVLVSDSRLRSIPDRGENRAEDRGQRNSNNHGMSQAGKFRNIYQRAASGERSAARENCEPGSRISIAGLDRRHVELAAVR